MNEIRFYKEIDECLKTFVINEGVCDQQITCQYEPLLFSLDTRTFLLKARYLTYVISAQW